MAGPASRGSCAFQAGSPGSGKVGWEAWVTARIWATKNDVPAASAIAAVTASSTGRGHEVNGRRGRVSSGWVTMGKDATDKTRQGGVVGVCRVVKIDDLARVPPAVAKMLADMPAGAQQQPDTALTSLDQRPKKASGQVGGVDGLVEGIDNRHERLLSVTDLRE